MRIPEDYPVRCYAGWLGKIIGVRLGAPVEGWEYDRIREVLGENVFDYIVDYHEFAADDDTNGPLFFLRALKDYVCSEELTAEEIGRTWLNYTPYEHGFYWWGGYGISTEHTAYLNLRAGIPAPRSGSIAQNGKTVAEQIGGQIFIDTWGLVNPGNPERAARFARKAASVSHDGEGICGGMFVAACIAQAFVEHEIRPVIEKGLSVLPLNCEYVRMARNVIAFYDKYPEDWRECYRYVRENYGYDRYPGNCHIIPNSAVMVLAMLYGDGDFTRTIGICTMCGWDTDCTTGNVGTILGVLVGLDGIDEKWRQPVHDLLVCSSVMGSLNIVDIPGSVFEMAGYAYRLNGKAYPEPWKAILEGRAARFHFDLPGSTHSFRVAGTEKYHLKNVQQKEGSGFLRCAAQISGGSVDIYHQTYYGKKDFTDSRYDPAFSPILYPGQRVSATVRLSPASDSRFTACVFAYDAHHNRDITGDRVMLTPGEWTQIDLQIPPIEGGLIERAGIRFEHCAGPMDWLIADVDDVTFRGGPDYSVDFSLEQEEHWTFSHREITQMTRMSGYWTLEENCLCGSGAGNAEMYTGDAEWDDYTVMGTLRPLAGDTHRLLARVQGGCRCYAAALAENGRIRLMKNLDLHYVTLAERDYPWSIGKACTIGLRCRGNEIQVLDDQGQVILETVDRDHPYLKGAVGMGVVKGRCAYQYLKIQALKSSYH